MAPNNTNKQGNPPSPQENSIPAPLNLFASTIAAAIVMFMMWLLLEVLAVARKLIYYSGPVMLVGTTLLLAVVMVINFDAFDALDGEGVEGNGRPSEVEDDEDEDEGWWSG